MFRWGEIDDLIKKAVSSETAFFIKYILNYRSVIMAQYLNYFVSLPDCALCSDGAIFFSSDF